MENSSALRGYRPYSDVFPRITAVIIKYQNRFCQTMRMMTKKQDMIPKNIEIRCRNVIKTSLGRIVLPISRRERIQAEKIQEMAMEKEIDEDG